LLARSYGLSVAPRIRFLNAKGNQSQKQAQKRKADEDEQDEESDEESGEEQSGEEEAVNYDEEDDLFTVKRVFNAQQDSDEDQETLVDANNTKKLNKVITKASIAKRVKKKQIVANQKIEYDEEGEVVNQGINTIKTKIVDEPNAKEIGGIDIEKARQLLRAEDKFDKDLYRQKIKQKHTEQRLKEKEKRREKRGNRNHNDDDEEEATATVLASNDHDEDGDDDDERNATEGEENDDGDNSAENSDDIDDGDNSDSNDD